MTQRSGARWRRASQILTLFGVLFSIVQAAPAHANWAQKHICNAANGLGQAEARFALFGRAMNGAIPADQMADALTNLNNAAAEMTAAEALFFAPIATARAASNRLGHSTAQIARFAAYTADWPFQQRAAYIGDIFADYETGLAQTFVSSRGDALRHNPNCDSFIARACYEYGKATIASTIDTSWGDAYQQGANGGFRDAIRKGLQVAMDWRSASPDPGHLRDPGHAKKICCTMGTPLEWEAMDLPSYQWSTPWGVYINQFPVMQGIISAAVELDPVCNQDWERCASSPSGERRDPTDCLHLIGRWRWHTGAEVDYAADFTWRTTDGQWTGRWHCNDDGSITITHDRGPWVDTVRIREDGNILDGTNQEGARVSAVRIGMPPVLPSSLPAPVQGPPACPGPQVQAIADLWNPPPYTGKGGLVCRDNAGSLWINVANTVYPVTSIQRGQKNPDSQCWWNSKVATPDHTYEGNLCTY